MTKDSKSEGKVRLEAALQTAAVLDVVLSDSKEEIIDEARLGHALFTIGRLASELSLFGPLLTTLLVPRWKQLNWTQRLLALWIAEYAPTQEFLPMLLEALQPDQHWFLRTHAVDALATLEGPIHIPDLDRLVDDEEPDVRATALNIIAARGDPLEFEKIEKSLADSEPTVRRSAVDLLGKRAGNRAMLLLLQTLDDKQMGVAIAAQRHLLARHEERDLAMDMIGRLQDFGPRGRYRQSLAVKSLIKLADERAVEPLVDHLTICRNSEVKKLIASALGKFGGEKGLPGLWTLLLDDNEKVRNGALLSLKKVPSPDSVPAFIEFMEKIERLNGFSIWSDPKLMLAAMAKIPGEAGDALILRALLTSQLKFVQAAVPHCKKRKIKVTVEQLAERLIADESKAWLGLREAYAALVDLEELDRALEESGHFQDEAEALDEAGWEDDDWDADDAPDAETPPGETYYQLTKRLKTASDFEIVAHAAEQADLHDIHNVAHERLHKINTPKASAQLRRFLRSSRLRDRAMAARTFEARCEEISDHDRAAICLYETPGDFEAQARFAHVIGDVLEETNMGISAHDGTIQVLWDSGHPYRVPFALQYLGSNANQQQHGRIALACLKTAPDEVIPQALEYLGKSGLKLGRPGEVALLLGRFKCLEAVEMLIGFLRDPDIPQDLQAKFTEALGMIGDERALPVLLEMLPEVFEGSPLRKVLQALAKLKAKDAIPAIEARPIKSPQLETVRQKALEQLRR